MRKRGIRKRTTVTEALQHSEPVRREVMHNEEIRSIAVLREATYNGTVLNGVMHREIIRREIARREAVLR